MKQLRFFEIAIYESINADINDAHEIAYLCAKSQDSALMNLHKASGGSKTDKIDYQYDFAILGNKKYGIPQETKEARDVVLAHRTKKARLIRGCTLDHPNYRWALPDGRIVETDEKIGGTLA